MSDKQLDPQQQAQYREGLEEQAQLLNISFRSSISDEKLRARIASVKEGKPQELDTDDDHTEQTITTEVKQEVKLIPQSEMKFSKEITNQEKRNKARQMVRVSIVCNDPSKKEWQGEILEVGNSVIGEIRKFIPFSTPWYVPQALLNMIETKQYQRFYTRKGRHGVDTRYGKNEKAYSISYIGNLSDTELQELAKRQMARGEEI